MERMGGKEQLLEQMYSAMATRRDETVDLALRSYGTLPGLLSHVLRHTHACPSSLICAVACSCQRHTRLALNENAPEESDALRTQSQGATWWVPWELRWTDWRRRSSKSCQVSGILTWCACFPQVGMRLMPVLHL